MHRDRGNRRRAHAPPLRRLLGTEAPKALARIVGIDEDLGDLHAALTRKFRLGERETLALLEGLRGRIVELIGAERAAIDSLAKAAA